ncbi:hypothetical protein U1Q18_038220 [Sarracenia purpurea var. burkii]
MSRSTGKRRVLKSSVIVVVAFAGLLGAVLVAEFLWASSSSSSVYLSIASYWYGERYYAVVIPNVTNSLEKRGDVKDENQRVAERLLSATFADLPAPKLEWEEMAPAPVPRLDGSAVQINNLLYVFAGYGTLDYVRFQFTTSE